MNDRHTDCLAAGLLAWLLLFCWAATAVAGTADKNSQGQDIRILIDVSGSMKHNDPDNLRRPALRLITQLLPPNSQAGVWTFGRWVNMLVPHGPVDTRWKTSARHAATEINSFGLFTNIEEALQSATWDWKESDDQQQRSIILLTDGLVDISKDASTNETSRQHILSQILPRLQQAGVKIYTIALSTDADRALLEQLAAASDGWHETVTSATELERVFFRMFEKAAKPETLPIVDNAVQVDDSINEVTFLIFRKTDNSVAKIITPDNNEFSQDNPADNVIWHHEKNYDLITVSRPPAGTWHIDADVDPDNRVMIVTDLKLTASAVPGMALIGDNISMDVSLREKGRAITKKEFMHFVNISLLQKHEGQEIQQWHLLDNGLNHDRLANDGVYNFQSAALDQAGKQELLLQADGTTFQRQRRQFVDVHEHALLASIRTNTDNHYELNVTPIAGLIEPDSLEITAVLDPDSSQKALTLQRINKGQWRLDLAEVENDRHRLIVNYQGRRPDGRTLTDQIGPLSFGVETETPPQDTATPPPLTSAESGPRPDTTKTIGPEIKQDVPLAPNWAFVISQVVLFNVLLGGGLVLAYKKWIKKHQDAPNPMEELDHA